MSAPIRYEKDGYLFEDPIGEIIPWPIAKIDSEGNKIFLSMDEINDWQNNYIKDHPEVQAKLNRIEQERNNRMERNKEIKPCFIEKLLLSLFKR